MSVKKEIKPIVSKEAMANETTGEIDPTVLGVRASVLETSVVMVGHALLCIVLGARMSLRGEEREKKIGRAHV